MWRTDVLWFDVAVVMTIFAVGSILFGRFEEHKSRSPAGTPAFYRVAELRFPSLASLPAFAASKGGQDAVPHAQKIPSGGAPVVMIAEEEVVTF